MMSTTISMTKQRFTLYDIAEFLGRANAAGAVDEDSVHVSVAPTSNMPTDPGGEITLSLTVTHD